MIAGVSLKGGVGRVEMVALGALFLLILTNAMDLLTIDPRIQTIFLGVIPFVITDIVRLVILISFPALATFLPGRM